MTTAQVVETSVTVNNNRPIQDYVHPNDQTQPPFEICYSCYFFVICASKCLTKFSYDHFLLKLQKIGTKLHQVAPNCTKFHQTAPRCTNLHQTSPSCSKLHHVAPIYTKLYQTAPICTNIQYTNIQQSAPHCTSLDQVARNKGSPNSRYEERV